MADSNKSSTDLSSEPRVVGTVHSKKSLAAALRVTGAELDFVELRVDAFLDSVPTLLKAADKIPLPQIITVRDKEQGGLAALSASERRDLFDRFLEKAALIDVELQSRLELIALVRAAKARDVQVIFSFHDFHRTPSLGKLRALCREAKGAGADVLKIATTVGDSRSLGTLLELLATEKNLPLSVMGMGPFGKISRLLCAACGSVLNYGYLAEPNASGQWPALVLKKRIAEVCTSAIREPTSGECFDQAAVAAETLSTRINAE